MIVKDFPINNLTSDSVADPLSAAQGKALKALIDALGSVQIVISGYWVIFKFGVSGQKRWFGFAHSTITNVNWWSTAGTGRYVAEISTGIVAPSGYTITSRVVTATKEGDTTACIGYYTTSGNNVYVTCAASTAASVNFNVIASGTWT